MEKYLGKLKDQFKDFFSSQGSIFNFQKISEFADQSSNVIEELQRISNEDWDDIKEDLIVENEYIEEIESIHFFNIFIFS